MKNSSILGVTMKKKYFLFYPFWALFLCLLIQSCKKDPKPEVEENTSPTTGTRTELSLDSVFLYAKQTYLWNDQLPTYSKFNPRKFTSEGVAEIDMLDQELFNITQIPVNPLTGKPYEYTSGSYPKYSYLMEDTKSGGSLSSVSLEGEGDDFGFALTATDINDIRIRYVNPGSPAAKAGLARGYRVTKINGRTITANTGGAFFDDAFDGSSMSLTVEKPDGTANVNLTQSFYISNPIFKKTILTVGSKSVGYLAYARFSNSANSESALKTAFNEFAKAGVADLVIDLRYNGGGYVNTAEYMSNLIAPSSLNGKVMYIEHYNNLMSSGKATILSKQILRNENDEPVRVNGRVATYADLDFSEEGNTYKFDDTKADNALQTVKNVYFIVTKSTASASELVINNLRPHLNVKIVGSSTYGKPVGFFPIQIDKYDVYMSNFSSRNAANQGDYYEGLTPDIAATDDVTRDFGDPQEVSLSMALASIINGNVASANTTMVLKGKRVMSSSSVTVKNIGKDTGFKGMIENRLKLKK
jgi:C-terminal processing protease CtpA/Prc